MLAVISCNLYEYIVTDIASLKNTFFLNIPVIHISAMDPTLSQWVEWGSRVLHGPNVAKVSKLVQISNDSPS